MIEHSSLPETDAPPAIHKALIKVPVPPSVNNAYANLYGKGRVPTKKLRQWRMHAGWVLNQQKFPHFVATVDVEISVPRRGRNADIDNRIKPILDLLTEHRLISDDKHVRRVSAQWIHSKNKDDLCEVEITLV